MTISMQFSSVVPNKVEKYQKMSVSLNFETKLCI